MNRESLSRLVMVVLALTLAFGLVACATNRPAGEQMDDAAITATVKTKLAADPQVNPFEIDVDTMDGVVTLSGTVDSQEEKSEAGKLARNTEGVVRVDNQLMIGSSPTAGEMVDCGTIITTVKSKLAADPDVSALNIDVDCEKGVVTLSGEVESAEQKEHAAELARQTHGVTRVDNQLQVGTGY
jgi:hyperosmotically inducible protein